MRNRVDDDKQRTLDSSATLLCACMAKRQDLLPDVAYLLFQIIAYFLQ